MSHDLSTLMSALGALARTDDPLADHDLALAARELHDITGHYDLDLMPGSHVQTALDRSNLAVPWEYRQDLHYITPSSPDVAGLEAVRDELAAIDARRAEVLARRARLAHSAYGQGLSVAKIGEALGVNRARADRIVKDGGRA